ncbi:hypothetical protein BURPSS13_0207 [Burkholderia pseudomallei S13]|nr:hypothetical protein BURPSS13_0207 [Burkholderia pseudomallei S13]
MSGARTRADGERSRSRNRSPARQASRARSLRADPIRGIGAASFGRR